MRLFVPQHPNDEGTRLKQAGRYPFIGLYLAGVPQSAYLVATLTDFPH